MRRETFTNRTLLALLASFAVASALGESPEPTKVRIATWNLEWFPNGSAHDATPEVQAQRIAAAADVLRPIVGGPPLRLPRARGRVKCCKIPNWSPGCTKTHSSVVLFRAGCVLRQEIAKLCGFAAIQTRLTFANNLDHAKASRSKRRSDRVC
jgi:hypothetical protein